MEFDEESEDVQVLCKQCTSPDGITIGEGQYIPHCTSNTTYSNVVHAFKFPPMITYSCSESSKYFQKELKVEMEKLHLHDTLLSISVE